MVRDGRIVCRPAIADVDGRTVTFTDGTIEIVDTIICATGYELDVPYLPDDVWRTTGPQLALHHRTIHPDLPAFGVIGQYALQGPYFPLLELQARWIAGLWSGAISPPADAEMREAVRRPPLPMYAHHVLAVDISEAAGVAPDLGRRPELVEPLLFGPMLPARYRLDGPGISPRRGPDIPGAGGRVAARTGRVGRPGRRWNPGTGPSCSRRPGLEPDRDLGLV